MCSAETTIDVLMSPLTVVWCHCNNHHNVPTVASALTNRDTGVHKSDRHPSEASRASSNTSRRRRRSATCDIDIRMPRGDSSTLRGTLHLSTRRDSGGRHATTASRRASSHHSLLSPCRTMYFFLLNQQI